MKKICFLYFIFFSLSAFAAPCPPNAIPRSCVSWQQWLSDLKKEVKDYGINATFFDRVFNGITPSRKHIILQKSQPEHRLTYIKYRNTRGDAYRIQLGKKYYKKHLSLLYEVGERYRVDPCIIVSLWGLESSYGNYMGSFSVIRSLATLAYSSKRASFFRKELILALQMLREGHVQLENFKGEWAGASGQSQFLPSSFYRYAVDYSGDGKRDIWKNKADIFASIANYLAKNGWQMHEPVLIPVRLPKNFNKTLMGYKQKKTVTEWLAMGVKLRAARKINHSLTASIIRPTGGPTFMIFNNFHTLMRWNRSSFYVGTVDYVARRICK